MKNSLKLLLGDFLVFRIKDFKTKWLPNNKQEKKNKKELEKNSKRKSFYGSFVEKSDLCFDVGANVGNRINPLLELGARIVAVEPQKGCCEILKYKFGNKIEIVNKGLGDSESIKKFHISTNNTLSSFSDEWINLTKNKRFKDYSWNKVVKVEVTTLDKLIEKYGEPVFIKIDVEGFELEVLKGLTRPVKLLSYEYTVPEQIDRVIECMEQIQKVNPKIECNYSIGESMDFALEEWQSPEISKATNCNGIDGYAGRFYYWIQTRLC